MQRGDVCYRRTLNCGTTAVNKGFVRRYMNYNHYN